MERLNTTFPFRTRQQAITVNGLQAGKRYRLMVVDWAVAGNMGQYHYIYFTTNQPPAADFDCSPKPVYNGDDFKLKNLFVSDGDAMTYSWMISGQAGYYNKSFTTNDVTIPGSVTKNHASQVCRFVTGDRCTWSGQ